MVSSDKPLRILWVTIAALTGCSFAAIASAQPSSATSSGSSRADIIEPLSITAVDDLDFGGIAVRANQGGSVQIDAATGTPSYSGAASPICFNASHCNTRSALFQIRGERGRSFVILLPSTVLALPVIGTGPSLLVSGMTAASKNQPTAILGGMLDSDGFDQIRVGGILQIPAGTPTGRYRAEIPLVVTYD